MLRNLKHHAIYQLVVGIWLTLSIMSVVAAGISWLRLSHGIAGFHRSTAIGPELDQILQMTLDSETGVRGFLITGNTNYLTPYNRVQPDYEREFDNLAALTANNPALLKPVLNLRATAEWLASYNRTALNARNHGSDAVRDLIASGKDQQIMDQIRENISDLRQIGRSQRLNAQGKLDAQLFVAILTSLAAGIVGVVAAIIAFWLAYVTKKKEAREVDLVNAMGRAERSSREKSVFLANMSHEIRTPMNAILGFSELLQGELGDTKYQKYIQSIRSGAASLLQLINDILDMSKIEAGVLELHPEPTDSWEIYDFVHTLFSEPALKKGIVLKCNLASDLPRSLLIDRVRLRQIMVNLVGNAIKFTDHGSVEVRISCEKKAGNERVALSIDVVDTGLGIPREKLGAIFCPFVQAGVHRDKEIQGTGLGLSIVKRLTELMGGTVTVTSVLGEGSTFSLRFPYVPISMRVPPSVKFTAGSRVDFNWLHASTILVMDDNEANCQYIDGIFKKTHHRLIFCSSGEDTIIKAREVMPDVALLDVRMPGMDGRQALAEIRKIPGMELVPAIAVTGSARPDDYFSGYLRKPFSSRELFDELAEFLPRAADDLAHSETSVLAEKITGPVPGELCSQLRQLLADPWPGLCNTMAVNEAKTFACRLEILAEQWHCKPLSSYAGKLRHDAETYAVNDLEKHLGEFAVLVENFGQNKG